MNKKWSVLAVMAGDNDLDGFAVADILEMEKCGSSVDVEILAHVDRGMTPGVASDGEGTTRRYRITKPSKKSERITSQVLVDFGPTNTGDPKLIKDFIKYGAQNAAADRSMLILWNHGSGFYVPPEMLSGKGAISKVEEKEVKVKLRRTFFHSTAKEILSQPKGERGILYDDGSADCLDNVELKRVLKYAKTRLGRKVDVLGMDACLMTMLEVAYQVKDSAQILVGSEETEPGDGWPYHKWLPRLCKKPSMEGDELSKVIVGEYIKSYSSGTESVTQAALDLNKLGDLTEAVDGLAKAMIKSMSLNDEEQYKILMAASRTTRFYESMYADLYEFAQRLQIHSLNAATKAACQGVLDAIDGRGAQTPIIAESHRGERMVNVRGISIYLPVILSKSAYYDDLDFAKRTKWGQFLREYHAKSKEVLPIKGPSKSKANSPTRGASKSKARRAAMR